MDILEGTDTGEEVPSIPEYYRGKTIFITGGTGFMGKVLIEKLLYSCPDLERIYLLLRNKRGVKPEARLTALYSFACFNRLREERPGAFESKVFFIAGDCGEIGLGLTVEDRALIIDQTQIVFHCAASIRFDDHLKVAAKINLRGAREMIELATHMQHLECFIHVSTAYSNMSDEPIEESLYPPLADWRDTLEICDNIDDHTLEVLTPKYLGKMPNTYVLTKHLAEHLVFEQKGKLPIVIFANLSASFNEPVPGWIDNFSGPMGLLGAGGKGILRIFYGSRSVVLDAIPVDIVIKGCIIASWVRATKKIKSPKETIIYNSCAGKLMQITLEELIKSARQISQIIPLDNAAWAVATHVTHSKFVYKVKVLLFHLLPAIIIDALLLISGRNPMLIKIQRLIYKANIALEYYVCNAFIFCNKKFIGLRSTLKEEDIKEFDFDIGGIDKKEFFKNCCLGTRRYLFKEKDEDMPKAVEHRKRTVLVFMVMKYLFSGYLFWWDIKI